MDVIAFQVARKGVRTKAEIAPCSAKNGVLFTFDEVFPDIFAVGRLDDLTDDRRGCETMWNSPFSIYCQMISTNSSTGIPMPVIAGLPPSSNWARQG